jgi:hypothetical protein
MQIKCRHQSMMELGGESMTQGMSETMEMKAMRNNLRAGTEGSPPPLSGFIAVS